MVTYNLFGTDIKRDDTTGFLSVSDLQKSYTSSRLECGMSDKRISDIMQAISFKKIIHSILVSINLVNVDLNTFYNDINDIGIAKYLKRLGIYKTNGARNTKETYCIDWLWRILYHSLYMHNSLVSVPKFILDIDNYMELSSIGINRQNSRELKFIEKFLLSSNLICNCYTLQYRDNGYIYDLKITLLGMEFVIEYHENQHSSVVVRDNDHLKYKNLKDRFAYIIVPYTKEQEQIEYIRECLTNRYTIEEINDIEFFRYESLLEDKYAIAINERVFGKHLTGMRNLASAQELKKITKIEQFISQGINMKMIKDDVQVMYAINHFSL